VLSLAQFCLCASAEAALEEDFSHKSFPPEPAKLAEMEFYLMEDLGCDLAVFHPYRTLLSLCCTEGSGTPAATERELGEYGAPDEDSQHYWGSGAGKLELPDGTLQLAW
jgi:cyclin C